MIIVHHLNDSRSQRILWLLEELRLPYGIKHYQRNPVDRLAPPELKVVHPLGKSPVITDDGYTVAESGAIIEYILRHHGGGKLQPDPASRAFDDYFYWMHYAEGSAMAGLILKITVARMENTDACITPRLDAEVASHLTFINKALDRRDYLLDRMFTAADIQMSFVGELASARTGIGNYANIGAWVRRFQARPAYRAALERGGAYSFVEGVS
jgi:glutathione S-transferase